MNASINKYQLTTILFIRFIVMLGFGIVIPVLPFLVEDLGGNALMLGIFMAVYSIMQFICAPFWGNLSDRIGRKPILLVGIIGYGLTFILFGLASNLYILILIRAASGIVSSATLPTTMAYISDSTDKSNRAKYMGMIGAASGMGMIIGPALGGILSAVSYSFSFYVAGIITLLVVPVIIKLLPESLAKENRAESNKKASRISLAAFKDTLIFIFIFNFLAYFIVSLFEGSYAYLGKDYVGLKSNEMGMVFLVLGIVSVIIQMGLISKLVKRFGEVKVLILGCVISAVGFVFIIFAAEARTLIGLVVAAAIYYAGNSLITPTASTLVSIQHEGRQGESMGYFSSFGSLGRMVGPVIGGALYDFTAFGPYILGIIMLISMPIIFYKPLSKLKCSNVK